MEESRSVVGGTDRYRCDLTLRPLRSSIHCHCFSIVFSWCYFIFLFFSLELTCQVYIGKISLFQGVESWDIWDLLREKPYLINCADELISIDIYIWSHNLVSSVEFLVDCEVLFSANKVEGVIKKEKKKMNKEL